MHTMYEKMQNIFNCKHIYNSLNIKKSTMNSNIKNDW